MIAVAKYEPLLVADSPDSLPLDGSGLKRCAADTLRCHQYDVLTKRCSSSVRRALVWVDLCIDMGLTALAGGMPSTANVSDEMLSALAYFCQGSFQAQDGSGLAQTDLQHRAALSVLRWRAVKGANEIDCKNREMAFGELPNVGVAIEQALERIHSSFSANFAALDDLDKPGE